MKSYSIRKITLVVALIVGLFLGLGLAVYGIDRETLPAQAAQAEPAMTAPVAAPELVAASDWDTEWSKKLGIKLLESYDSSGPAAWDPKQHPVVFITTEGLGYGGLLSADVTNPGLAIIDAKTHEVVAAPHFDVRYEEYCISIKSGGNNYA